MKPEIEERLISTACKEAGLDSHIRWIKRAKDAGTWAERIAERFREGRDMPVKNSYMYCDTLDMCFFYDRAEKPHMTYAGYATASSPDITEGKLVKAFEKAQEVLKAMSRLAAEQAQET